MNEKPSSLTLRMGIALLFAFLLHLILMVFDISPKKDTPSPRLAVLLKAPLPEKKLEEKRPLPKPEKPKQKVLPKPKPKPKPKVIPKPKPKPKPKVIPKPKPKPKKKPVEVRQEKFDKKKKPELTPPPKKKPKPKEIEKPKPKKIEPPKKEEEKFEPLPKKIVKKILPPKKKAPLQTRLRIETPEQYEKYLESQGATTNRNVSYIPPIEVMDRKIPTGARQFFRMKTVVLKKSEIYKSEKTLVVEVDLEKKEFTRIEDPVKYQQKFGYLAFLHTYPSQELFTRIAQTYQEKYHLQTRNLLLFALVPPGTGFIFDWKCLKTIEKAGYKPEEVVRIDGKFRRFGDIWIFEIQSLMLKTGEEVIIDDFEVKMLKVE